MFFAASRSLSIGGALGALGSIGSMGRSPPTNRNGL